MCIGYVKYGLRQKISGKLHQYGCSGHQAAVVKDILGVMKPVTGVGIRIVSGAKAELGAGAVFREQIGEILGAKGRILDRYHMIRADGLFRGGLEPVDHRLVVDKRRHSFFPGHLSVPSHGLGTAFYDAVDGVLHGLAAFRIQASESTGHFYEIGDYVIGLSAVDAADGHNARIYGVILPGDHGLKLG